MSQLKRQKDFEFPPFDRSPPFWAFRAKVEQEFRICYTIENSKDRQYMLQKAFFRPYFARNVVFFLAEEKNAAEPARR